MRISFGFAILAAAFTVVAGGSFADTSGIASTPAVMAPAVPNSVLTTGSLCEETQYDFLEYRYSEEIPYCRRNVSQRLKDRVYADYGIPSHCRSNYTIDHYIPLSIGGDNKKTNLWPEHRALRSLRQSLETRTYSRLKNGRITHQEALNIIVQTKNNPPDGARRIGICDPATSISLTDLELDPVDDFPLGVFQLNQVAPFGNFPKSGFLRFSNELLVEE